MPIDYPSVLEQRDTRRFSWRARDAQLYAIAVGMAQRGEESELPFVLEDGLRVMPSFVTVAPPRAGARLLIGLDYARVVDAARTILLDRPLPPAATVTATTRVASVVDKGPGKGALVTRETELRDEADDGRIARILTTTFARGDGGHGGDPIEPPRRIPPARAPDLVVDEPTWPNQALLYRLCGDFNPLHADPAVARRAGFPGPILHGMCSFGIACRVLLKTVLDHDAQRLASMAARFTAPVFPGETLRFSLWIGADEIDFEVAVPSRGSTVIEGGHAGVRAAGIATPIPPPPR